MSEQSKDSRFLDKWKLVRAAAKENKRLSTGDISVLIAICDRYGSKYNRDAPAVAGHALLASMTGLSRRATIDSTRRLIDAGYIAVLELGSGTRGTKYGLNFPSSEPEITTNDIGTSGEPQFTTVVNQTAPLMGSSGEPCFTESPPTSSHLQVRLDVVGTKFEDAASTLAVGQEATAALPPSGEGNFETFWKIWPRKHGLKKARAEWAKVESNAGLIIDAARAWAAHYASEGVDKKWIAEPANWLAGERWLEDLPIIHGDAKGAAIAKAKANAKPKPAEEIVAANDDQPAKPDFTVYPDERVLATIDGVENYVFDEDGAKSLTVTYLTGDGRKLEKQTVYESPDFGEQVRGQAELQKVFSAAGLPVTDDFEALLGKPVELLVNQTEVLDVYRPWTPEVKLDRPAFRFADIVKKSKHIGEAA